MSELVYEVYEEGDIVLPLLHIPDPCSIRVEIHAKRVRLFVGPRDWTWNRESGLLTGTGTENMECGQ